MTSKLLLAVGLGGVVATTIGIATAQPSIADSFFKTIDYTTSPAPILVSANTASEVEIDIDRDDGEVEIEVENEKKHGFFNNIVGMPLRVIKAPLGVFRHDDEVSVNPAMTSFSVVPNTVSTRTVTSAVVIDDSCNHAKVLSSPAVIDMQVESPAVIRSTTGVPFMVERRNLQKPLMRRVVAQPSMIEVNRVVERPTVIQRVISQPVVIEKFVEKPAIVECVTAPTVISPTVINKSITAPVIILDDDSDRFLYDFSTHRRLKIDLDD